MNTSYEIRTMRNRPVFAFDNETRAREEMAKASKRIGTQLRLIRVTKLEEEITEPPPAQICKQPS